MTVWFQFALLFFTNILPVKALQQFFHTHIQFLGKAGKLIVCYKSCITLNPAYHRNSTCKRETFKRGIYRIPQKTGWKAPQRGQNPTVFWQPEGSQFGTGQRISYIDSWQIWICVYSKARVLVKSRGGLLQQDDKADAQRHKSQIQRWTNSADQ